MVDSAATAPHGEVDAAGEDDEGHAHGEHDEEGVVDEEVRHHLAGGEVLVAHRADPPEGHREHREGRDDGQEALGKARS